MKPAGASLIGFGTGTAGGATFRAFDPARGVDLEPVFQSVSGTELEQAVQLAAGAAPAWAKLSGAERNKFLRLIADKLDQHAAILAERAAQETGLPLTRCTGSSVTLSPLARWMLVFCLISGSMEPMRTFSPAM